MLRRRSSFEFGRKSILYLVLASAFNGKFSAHCSSRITGKMLPLPKPYDAQYKEFGCVFADNEYKINRNPNNKQFPAPTWSEEGIDSMSLTIDPKDNYWKPIENYLSEDTVMNDVSPFVQFVKTFKIYNSDSGETLESVFNNYDVPLIPYTYGSFEPREISNPAAYVIQMFRRLKENQSQPGKSVPPCYLVSAYVDPMDVNISDAVSENGENMSQDKLVQKLRQTRVQDHLAGIIKIDSGNRTGYILMDPGYANGENLFHPFVVYVMEDGKHPHGEFMNGFRNSEQIEFTKREGNPFILANYKNLKSVTNVLYYVGKPYCSFMENTIKANLLRLNHGIIARDPKSHRQGYLTFKISPENKKEKDHNNWLIIREIGNTTSGEMKESFMNFSNPMLVNETIDSALGISITKSKVTMITAQLQYIQTELFGNSKLMSKFIELNNKHGLDKEGQKSKNIFGRLRWR